MAQAERDSGEKREPNALDRALANLAVSYALGLIDTSKPGSLGYGRDAAALDYLPSRREKPAG